MSIINSSDKEKIKKAWSQGLTRASFGGGKGTCQITGSKDGSVVLYVYDDKKSFVTDYRDEATPYLFSMTAYKSLKKELDTEFPQSTSIKEDHLKKAASATKVVKKPFRPVRRQETIKN